MAKSSALPSITQHLRAHGIVTNKRLGQHFLTDPQLLDKIACAGGALLGAHILEIGPGPAGLTRAILAHDPAALTVIERDTQFLPLLQDIAAHYTQLQILHEDALEVEYAAIAAGNMLHIVANLPYNIGTELIIRWLQQHQLFSGMTLLIQKEVAERLAAKEGNKQYGWLSILTQLHAEVEYCFTVPPEAFFPPPKVDSAVVHLTPRDQLLHNANLEALEPLCKAAFQQRRKMLRKSLKSYDGLDAALEKVGIAPTARPETVPIEAWCALAECLG